MATVIRHKKSTTGGAAPSTSAIALGEIAINTTDGDLYIKKSVSGTESIVKFSSTTTGVTDNFITVNAYTGNGSNRAFTLGSVPQNDQYVFITINGIQQNISTYSLVGSALTFTTAPATGDAVEARVISVTTTAVSLRDYQSYVYTVSSTTTSITGSDDNSVTLAYDINKLNVYQNGVRLVRGSDYAAANGTTVTFTTSLVSGDVIEIESFGKASIADHDSINPNTAALSTTATNQTIDSFVKTKFRSAKYLIQATAGSAYHCSEVLLLQDGTNTHMTEYGTIQTGSSLYTLSADINGDNVRLLCSPVNANTTIKLQRITVAV
jgi:hypothetical protein